MVTEDLKKKIEDELNNVMEHIPAVEGLIAFKLKKGEILAGQTLTELNHNEIVGWEMDNPCLKNYLVIFLESEITHSRINARIQLTKNIIRDKGVNVVEIYAQGTTVLENILSLIGTGDWVSYYLALLYDKNPEAILNIDYLKSELKKLG